ncbi:hypothetical protein O0I10_009540 [Lichtheimia ornata]|uniref:CCHC-type domain-containing protein n=1 Tax=Lichtheimia ornata TaxID=688661 RepID=A0AAD7XVR4_9FUNG|nr:uncharacterized protein O0I10_009540 [Lichtheimia ornata]KAJ8654818.1 hypothetical protein O0I10_009540 [Lichtheimia ornata]
MTFNHPSPLNNRTFKISDPIPELLNYLTTNLKLQIDNRCAGVIDETTTRTKLAFEYRRNDWRTPEPSVVVTTACDKEPPRCYNCGGLGHLQRSCPSTYLVNGVIDLLLNDLATNSI